MQHLLPFEEERIPHAQGRLDRERIGEERNEPSSSKQLGDHTVDPKLLRHLGQLDRDKVVKDCLLDAQPEQRGGEEVHRQQELDHGGEAPEGRLGLLHEDEE